MRTGVDPSASPPRPKWGGPAEGDQPAPAQGASGFRQSSRLAVLVASSLVALLAPTGCRSTTTHASIESPKEVVLVLHGLFRSRFSMRTLHNHLDRAGYHAVDWPYPSTCHTLVEHGERLCATLRELDQDPTCQRIHIVGHSLGGSVARQALSQHVPQKMGRVVMLASPNQGAKLARVLQDIVGNMIRPLAELSDAPESAIRQLGAPPAGVEVGTIAGNRDTTVPEANARLEGARDHLVVSSGHTFIMNQDEVLEQVRHFLEHGQFARNAPDSPESPSAVRRR